MKRRSESPDPRRNDEQSLRIGHGRRVRSDLSFFLVTAAIGLSYVLLILFMLLADASYIFTSRTRREVIVDFSSGKERGTLLRTGELVSDQFLKYGLEIVSSDSEHPPRILDSDKPSAANSQLGTPHQQYGGPGFGAGGVGGETPNSQPLGNVLIVAADAAPLREESARGEFVQTWTRPVRLEQVSLTGLEDGPITLTSYNESGDATQHAVPAATDRVAEVTLAADGVVRVDVSVPNRSAEILLDYSLSTSTSLPLRNPRKEELQLSNLRVVPPGAAQLRPRADGGRLTFTWQDAVIGKRLRLLNVTREGSLVELYDGEGNLFETQVLAPGEPNNIRLLQLPTREISRMEVVLQNDAAVAEVVFEWEGRIRSAWEREHPRMARLFYNPITISLQKPEIQYSIRLSLISCTLTALLSLWVAVPTGYLLSRHQFYGKTLIDAVLDIPIVLPPLVVGLSLLILFQFWPFNAPLRELWPLPESWAPWQLDRFAGLGDASLQKLVVYEIPAVIVAQFAVACAFAVRTMRATFDQIDARREQVALTLGCSRFQAFGRVVLPEAHRGMLTAGTLAWARSLGEFGPLLVFAGATRNKTEVLSTTVFLELSVGDLGAAVAVSLIMVAAAVVVLVLARALGTRRLAI